MLEARLEKIKDDWIIIKSFFGDLDNIKQSYNLSISNFKIK